MKPKTIVARMTKKIEKELGPTKKVVQANRHLKLVCPSCGTIIRMGKRAIQNPGPPICSCVSKSIPLPDADGYDMDEFAEILVSHFAKGRFTPAAD